MHRRSERVAQAAAKPQGRRQMCMYTDPRKVRRLLEEYASLIPLSGALPPEDKARMQDLERELLKLGCIVDLYLDSLVTPL